jgi:hypothetical protein
MSISSSSRAPEGRRSIARGANPWYKHRRMTFQEEFIAFPQRHGISYDERYLWD